MSAERVTVYSFRTLDSGYESSPVAPFKATRLAIVELFQGDPIEGTAEEVPASEVDAQGRFLRRATGWGELR